VTAHPESPWSYSRIPTSNRFRGRQLRKTRDGLRIEWRRLGEAKGAAVRMGDAAQSFQNNHSAEGGLGSHSARPSQGLPELTPGAGATTWDSAGDLPLPSASLLPR
jgi:hypothetical protein